MTRADLEADLYQDFGYAAAPASSVTTRIRSYLNLRHRRILNRAGLEKLRFESQSFATVASTIYYWLAGPVEKILKMTDTTNNQPLYERGLDWYRTVDPDPSEATSVSQYWIPLGITPARRDIGASGAGDDLYIVSTAAADAMSTTVETIDVNGSLTTTNTTLNGLTRVQVGTATNHERLTRFSIASAATGRIELYDAAAAGNLISYIALGRTSAQFNRIALWPTPSAANTIVVDYLRHTRDLTEAASEPDLPLDFHYLVSLGAKIDEARQKGNDDQRAKAWGIEYETGIRELLTYLVSYDTLVIPGDYADRGRSNLGAGYPAGIW